ncbi:MAG TPA: sensor histidine kinase [Sedimenticola thiotaurini]|uniref:Sensor histidine kinase n=1 Tax=Sedimenticola thiotaurini TaxID=1543721 RepID=A0A831W5Z4_9GAMM|nr:sensor histidine kinase [Sedimenticola thiotaurini]
MPAQGRATTAQERDRAFLPSFCSIRTVFGVVVSAELLAVMLSLGNLGSLHRIVDQLSLHSLFIQWVALAGIGALCLLRPWLRGRSHGVAGLLAWLVLLLVTLLVSLGARMVLEQPLLDRGGILFLVQNLGIAAVASALILRYLYVQYQWRRQVEAESEARFQALQSRIRPHFLFNSMNTIANLTRSDPRLAEEVVYDLSDLFRASLADVGRRSTLGDELELARGYLRIEQLRLGERLRVEWDLEGLPEQALLPALVLQPLLENAVYHGIEPAQRGGVIHISGRYRRRRVNLSIRNSMPEEAERSRHHRSGNRMALDNTRQRLQGFFAGEASLTVGEVDGQHQVRLTFPYPWNEG